MTVDLVRERSNLDRLSLWRSRFRVLSLKRIIKRDLRRGLQACLYASKRAMLGCKQERMLECKHESMHVWVHESMSVWEAHSWSLGVKRISSGDVSFHYRRFRDREAIRNGARAADWTVSFISVNQISKIVISEQFIEIEIERYTEC